VLAQRSLFAEVVFDHVHVVLVRPPSEVVADTTIAFTPGTPQVILNLFVKIRSVGESFAVTVEREGVDRWLAAHGTEAQRRAFDQQRARSQAFAELVAKYRARLAELYAEPLDPAKMRSRKQEVLAQMRAEYERMKQSWDGYTGYDWWFEQPLNNAQLASLAIYTQLVPAFERILQDNGGDLQRFYAEVKRIAALPEAQRDTELGKLNAARG
jgi:predicted aminopeptidase